MYVNFAQPSEMLLTLMIFPYASVPYTWYCVPGREWTLSPLSAMTLYFFVPEPEEPDPDELEEEDDEDEEDEDEEDDEDEEPPEEGL